MSKFFFNHNPATVEDGRLVKYAEIIYGEGGRSVLENLMVKASIRLRIVIRINLTNVSRT